MRTIALVCAVLLASACAPRLYSDGVAEAWSAPENRWPTANPEEELVGGGFTAGQIAYDIRGQDQFNEEVSLWQFWGNYVLVDIATMWCGPCQELAKGTEEMNQDFKDKGVVYLSVLTENDLNEPPSIEELNIWAQFPSFNDDPDHPYDLITSPIIADPNGENGSKFAIRDNLFPVAILVGPDMRVVERIEPVTEASIRRALEAVVGAE